MKKAHEMKQAPYGKEFPDFLTSI